jgi:hypothetical protein
MLNKSLIIFFLSFIMYPLIGQTYDELNLDTLNQVDENGSKTGYWVELLSKDFKVVKKEKKASFYRFVYFQNDVRFDAKIPTYNVPFKEFVVKLDGTSQKGEIKILNGKFSFFYTTNKYFESGVSFQEWTSN